MGRSCCLWTRATSPAIFTISFALLVLQATADYNPIFVTSTPTNVTVYDGDTVTLNCSVMQLATKRVIWRFERRKASVSIGTEVFISDSRFSVVHTRGRFNWDLVIKNVRQGKDNGRYECQVPITPPMRRYVYLRILPAPLLPKPEITGADAIEIGEEVKLQCDATSNVVGDPPPELDWFMNGNHVMPTADGETEVVTTVKGNRRTSKLVMKHASLKDSGTYVCRAATGGKAGKTAKMVLSILNTGKSNKKRGSAINTAPQTGETRSTASRTTSFTLISTVVVSIASLKLFKVH